MPRLMTPPRHGLRRQRRLCGLSQSDLARKLRVGRSVVSGWESGARRPGDRLIPHLSEALELERVALLPLIDG